MKNVLLIGNNKEVDTLTAKLLARYGYDVCMASEYTSGNPDLILIDCDLSPKVGFEKYAKWIDQWQAAKILWISNEEEDEVRALEFGADDFMKKPYHFEVLLARMSKLCKRKTS